jgi:hypothetical protein
VTDDRIIEMVRNVPMRRSITAGSGDFMVTFARMVEHEVLMEAAVAVSKGHFFELPDASEDGRVSQTVVSCWLTGRAKKAMASIYDHGCKT